MATSSSSDAAQQSSDAVQQRIDGCQGLVRSLAMGIHRKVPANVELDDLIAYGQIGLVEAARDFDPSRGSRFSTYAYYRIRGAIYDGLGKMSWFGRAEHNHARYEQMANEVLSQEAEQSGQPGQTATDDTLWLRNLTRALAVVYLSTHRESEGELESASLVDPSTPPAITNVIRRELHEKLNELIDALPAEAAGLIRGVYFEGLTLQEAGKRLGVSKSWASRLHAKALQRLAHSLKIHGVTEEESNSKSGFRKPKEIEIAKF